MLAVNAWDEPPATVRGFVGQQGIRYPVLLRGRSVAMKYGVRGVPAAYFIDPEGQLVGTHVGLSSLEELEAAVKEILPRR